MQLISEFFFILLLIFFRVDDKTMTDYVALATELREEFPTSVAGFDLVAQEDLGRPLKEFINELSTLSEKGVPVFFHAGETSMVLRIVKKD